MQLPQLTSTRVAQSAQMPMCAAGGAMSVPNDHSATPAMSTLTPPILQAADTKQRQERRSALETGLRNQHAAAVSTFTPPILQAPDTTQRLG
jgi:hypothetical protein